tara:strand:+ start:300 stop:470 length:171 start_codon:yes stop_codon:yes gene_type:complete
MATKKTPRKLTSRQQATLKKHAVHHTKKHMDMMRKAMRGGSTFSAAHKMAQKKVGK